MEKTQLAGAPPTILIIEDDWLVANDLMDALHDAGFQTQGPAHTVSKALDLLNSAGIDGALLDVNLGGRPSYPVADAMIERDIPFAFLSGYTSAQLRVDLQDRPILSKPVDLGALVECLRLLVGQ